MKPIIGISTSILTMESGLMPGLDRVYVNEDYVKAIEKAGGIPILLPPIESEEDIYSQYKVCDGFIFSGGVDINPIFYGENPEQNLSNTNFNLDEYQLKLCKFILENDKPLLGICRGHQLINIALGGSLYQDLSTIPQKTFKHFQESKRFEKSHKVILKKGSILFELFGKEIFVNSFHHQAIKILGKNLNIIATSEDNLIEAIFLKNKKFVLGLQWHPEMLLNSSNEMLPIFKILIEKSSSN